MKDFFKKAALVLTLGASGVVFNHVQNDLSEASEIDPLENFTDLDSGGVGALAID